MKCLALGFLVVGHLGCAMEPAIETCAGPTVSVLLNSPTGAGGQRVLRAVTAIKSLITNASCWMQLGSGTRRAIKILLLTLSSAAASHIGYMTGHDWLTLLCGSIAGPISARFFRDDGPFRGFLIGLALWLGGATIDVYLLNFQYKYGTVAVEATFWLTRALYDCFEQLTGRSSSDSELYAALPRDARGAAQAEYARLGCDDIESGFGAQSIGLSRDLDIGLDIV